MRKQIAIKRCCDCPHESALGFSCGLAGRGFGEGSGSNIPTWCPLPDYADRQELLAALEKIDAHLSRSADYEGGWINYPDKPEISLADMCRGLVAKHKAGKE